MRDDRHRHGIELGGTAVPALLTGYLACGVLVFVLGWTRLYVAVPTCAAYVFCTWRMLRSWRDEAALARRTVGRHEARRMPGCDAAARDADVTEPLPLVRRTRMSPSVFACAFVVLLLVGYLCGWGGFVPQSGDWHKHNAVLHDLIDCPWPVVYRNRDETSLLTYYVAPYLLPALLGKATGSFEVAEVALGAWNFAGLFLVYLGCVRVTRASDARRQLAVLVALLCFGALVAPGSALVARLYPGIPTGEGHWFAFTQAHALQYTPNLVQLRWVFGQALGTWACMLLFFEHRDDIRFYVVFGLPVALYGILPFCGVLVLMVSYAVVRLVAGGDRRAVIAAVFSLENLLMTLTLGVMLFCYFSGNIFSSKPSQLSLRLVGYSGHWLMYLVFAFFSFGVWALLVAPAHRRDPVFWICVACLLALPFFHLGAYNDLVMRASIPFLFLLMLMVDCRLFEAGVSRIVKVALCVCLVVASYTPVREIALNERGDVVADLTQAADGYLSLGYSANRSLADKPEDLRYNYESYDLEHNAFVRLLGRTPLPQVRED